MNADEIVKALRHCYQEDIQGCYGCPLNRHDLCYEANLELSAANLIESLQAQLAESQRMEDKIQIFVLKRSNGFMGIYVGSHKHKNLVSNFPQSMKADHLFDMIMMEVNHQSQPCEIIFTEDER